jgi:hypothetical protein
MALYLGSGRNAVEAPGQNALLRVQAVFGLVEHHRLRAVDHLVGDLLAAMGRQAVHEQRVGLGQRHQLGVDLIGLEQLWRCSPSLSPIETQVSVTTQSAPRTAASGSCRARSARRSP